MSMAISSSSASVDSPFATSFNWWIRSHIHSSCQPALAGLLAVVETSSSRSSNPVVDTLARIREPTIRFASAPLADDL